MMTYSVYILKLSNRDYYVGRSDDLKRGLKDHFLGQERTTRNFLPLTLEAVISFKKKDLAFNFEKYLKTGSGIAFRNKHLV